MAPPARSGGGRDARPAGLPRGRASLGRARLARAQRGHRPAARAAARGDGPRPRDWQPALGAARAHGAADQGAAR
eukprot:2560354-Prymnesium_polylepis.1